jgi:hypothetical protein
MVGGFSSLREGWAVSGKHGRAYLGLLSGMQAADVSAHSAVTKALDHILKD